MEKKLLIGLLALSTTGCVTTQVAHIPRVNMQEPEVFMTQLPARTYAEVSYIEAAGGVFHTKSQLLRKLKDQARKENADALIQVRFRYAHIWPYAEGIGIKYQE